MSNYYSNRPVTLTDTLVKGFDAELYDFDIDDNYKIPSAFISLEEFIHSLYGEDFESVIKAKNFLSKRGFLDEYHCPSAFSINEKLMYWFIGMNPLTKLFDEEHTEVLLTTKGQCIILDDIVMCKDYLEYQKDNNFKNSQ